MEKQGVVRPGTTRDTEGKLAGEKQAGQEAKTNALDDDATKRMSDAFARPKKPEGSGS